MKYYPSLHLYANYSKGTACSKEKIFMQINMTDYPSLHLYTNYSKGKDIDVNEHERLSVITLIRKLQ